MEVAVRLVSGLPLVSSRKLSMLDGTSMDLLLVRSSCSGKEEKQKEQRHPGSDISHQLRSIPLPWCHCVEGQQTGHQAELQSVEGMKKGNHYGWMLGIPFGAAGDAATQHPPKSEQPCAKQGAWQEEASQRLKIDLTLGFTSKHSEQMKSSYINSSALWLPVELHPAATLPKHLHKRFASLNLKTSIERHTESCPQQGLNDYFSFSQVSYVGRKKSYILI